MRGDRFIVGLIPMLVACGASSEAPSATADADEWTVPASETTQTEVGVKRWALTPGNLDADVRGYDADDAPVLEFRHRREQTVDQYMMRYRDETVRYVIAIGAAGERTVVESTFVGKYARAAALMALDLDTSLSTRERAQHADLSTQTLRPLDGPVIVVPDDNNIVYADDCPGVERHCKEEQASKASAAGNVPSWCPRSGPADLEASYADLCETFNPFDDEAGCMEQKKAECVGAIKVSTDEIDPWCNLENPEMPLSKCRLVKRSSSPSK